MNGLPDISPQQLLQVQESQEIHRRSSLLCTAVFQLGGFVGKEQPLNSLAWQEPFHQQFLQQCSCYVIATPACQWGLDWFKTWAIAATSERIQPLPGTCSHQQHFNFRGKSLPDGTFISSLSAEYPSALASAIIDIIKPWVSQTTTFNFDMALWKSRSVNTLFIRPSHNRWCWQLELSQLDNQERRTLSKNFERDGHQESSNPIYIPDSQKSLCQQPS